jgi:tetratricopeptide (TPR) repeat protein
VVTRSPDNPVARYNLGRAHIAKGEWEQARQAFQKAIELRPDYMLARLALAQLLVTRGDFDAALKSAQEILKVDRQNKNAQLIESAAFLGQKKYAESRAMLNAMLTKNPNSPDVLFQLGVVNLAEGKYKDASDSFKRTYELNPANSRGLMGMVETDMAENKPDEAIKTLESEAAKAPNRLDVQLALGNTEVRAGRYDLAIGYFQRVLNGLDKTTKARGDIYMRIGETYRRKGDLQDSISALEDARKFLPDNIVILSTLGLVLDSAGKWPEAKQVYSATLKMDPNNAVSLNNLAFLMAEHGDSGDLDTALTMAQKAKQMLPNLPEVSDTLGWIYLKKNLSGDAVDIFKDLVSKVPNSSTYHYHLAKAYAQQGDKVRAKSELQAALKLNPTAYEKAQIEDLLQKVQ